jgi:4-hydroxy-3-polyprenylbenzoate decarboxylase
MGKPNSNEHFKRILIGVTGASGSVYASRLLEVLLPICQRIYLVCTETGEQVARHELSGENPGVLARALSGNLLAEEKEIIRVFKNSDFFAPVASGSSAPHAMVVVPCSMGSLSRIAHGTSSNLLERAADVILKQKRQLIICPRETPFSLIHLRNLTQLAEAGAEILPLMPGFYQKPESMEDLVDFCVGRILEQLGFSHELYKRWNPRML